MLIHVLRMATYQAGLAAVLCATRHLQLMVLEHAILLLGLSLLLRMQLLVRIHT